MKIQSTLRELEEEQNYKMVKQKEKLLEEAERWLVSVGYEGKAREEAWKWVEEKGERDLGR